MGQEAECVLHYNGSSANGKALLETDRLLFRGEMRLHIPFGEVTALEAADGRLRITTVSGTAIFELGGQAARWADRIRNPRTLMDKLGVKPGDRVVVLRINDPIFNAQLRARQPVLLTPAGESESGTSASGHSGSNSPSPGNLDWIFLGVEAPPELARLHDLRTLLAPKGAIWVISPKGKGALLKDTEIMAAAKQAGLVDTKVVAFSATHTGLKLVIPLARRQSQK